MDGTTSMDISVERWRWMEQGERRYMWRATVLQDTRRDTGVGATPWLAIARAVEASTKKIRVDSRLISPTVGKLYRSQRKTNRSKGGPVSSDATKRSRQMELEITNGETESTGRRDPRAEVLAKRDDSGQ